MDQITYKLLGIRMHISYLCWTTPQVYWVFANKYKVSKNSKHIKIIAF